MFFSYICYTDPDPDGAFPGPEPLPMTRNKDIFTFRDAEKQTGPVAFSTMLKPAGSACNLDCHYCYYLNKAVQYGGRQAVMPDELLERYIRQYIEANDVPTVTFCWHGGESLLLGIDFYRRALALQQKYADGKRIENTLQTNGTLIDEAWCDLFAANNFLVGLSLDGPEDLHDAFRRTKGGRPTFRRVMQTVEMFRARGVEYNTLSVVNRLSEGRGAEIYRFFRDTVRSRYMQFLPAVEHVVDVEGFHRPLIVSPEREGARLAEWSVTADGYGQFLCDVFDEWVVGDVGQVFVQMFDATLAQWCGVQPGVCSMGETCGDALVVEHNGDVYSCDHFVYPEATSAWRSAMPCRPSACAAVTTSPAGASARSTASRPDRTAAAKILFAKACTTISATWNLIWSTCARCSRRSSRRHGSSHSRASAWV